MKIGPEGECVPHKGRQKARRKAANRSARTRNGSSAKSKSLTWQTHVRRRSFTRRSVKERFQPFRPFMNGPRRDAAHARLQKTNSSLKLTRRGAGETTTETSTDGGGKCERKTCETQNYKYRPLLGERSSRRGRVIITINKSFGFASITLETNRGGERERHALEIDIWRRRRRKNRNKSIS